MNDISLTVRLPQGLNRELADASKRLGMTKTNLIRIAIHTFLVSDNAKLVFASSDDGSPKARMVLNVNQLTHEILLKTSEKHGQSINAVVIAVGYLALEYAAKLLS